MIVVIADDLTGAAELAGVGWRHGLESEVWRTFDLDSEAELVVVDADTRSMPVTAAVHRVAALAELCRQRGVKDVFKKVDSVLRGHVIAEMTALMVGLGRTRGLLLPANPGLGRTVVGGRYFVGGVPLNETEFAQDPAHPVQSVDVLDILGPSRVFPVSSADCSTGLPERGIVAGDALASCDVDTWAVALDASVLPAGAAEFFAGCLNVWGYGPDVSSGAVFVPDPTASSLFVSGSSSAASHEFCMTCEFHGIPVMRMPLRLFDGLDCAVSLLAEWSVSVLDAFDRSRVVVLAIERPVSSAPDTANRLACHLTTAAARVLADRPIQQVFVEGGSTAAALVQRLGWDRLRAVAELAPGTISLRALDGCAPVLTMKPGSYEWPVCVHALLTGAA